MSDNRAPGRVWALRRDLKDYVRTDFDDQIVIYVSSHPYTVSMDRRMARLLAKRINECLDATVKS